MVDCCAIGLDYSIARDPQGQSTICGGALEKPRNRSTTSLPIIGDVFGEHLNEQNGSKDLIPSIDPSLKSESSQASFRPLS
jgi:hypothetical protein